MICSFCVVYDPSTLHWCTLVLDVLHLVKAKNCNDATLNEADTGELMLDADVNEGVVLCCHSSRAQGKPLCFLVWAMMRLEGQPVSPTMAQQFLCRALRRL